MWEATLSRFKLMCHENKSQHLTSRLASCRAAFLIGLFCTSCTLSAAGRDEVIFFANDALGSAVAAVNEKGDLCWYESYTPYGDKTINDDVFSPPGSGCGVVGEERGYTGHTEDVNSDLVYMQQRYYDPSIGRFLSVDPQDATPENPSSYNRYAYANNNPYKYTDPDGEAAFLIPVAMFIAKEIAAEVASRATNGASDLLSLRRMGSKAARGGANVFRKLVQGCSFAPDTQVLTADGYRAIVNIEPNIHEVWSMDELTGQMSLQPVLEAMYAHYDETMYLELRDGRTGSVQTMVSNTIHPYFIQRDLHAVKETRLAMVAYRSNESPISVYRGEIENGQWVEAADILVGDRMLTAEGHWSSVISVQRKDDPLTAFNIHVANTNTYFASGSADDEAQAVWVHNCGSRGSQEVYGNSKQSTKAQHGYEIVDTKTNTVCKTGVSGCGLNINGTSPRANSQANKWNKEPGNAGRYQPRVVKEIPEGEGARQEILKWEQQNAARLRRQLDPARHLRP